MSRLFLQALPVDQEKSRMPKAPQQPGPRQAESCPLILELKQGNVLAQPTQFMHQLCPRPAHAWRKSGNCIFPPSTNLQLHETPSHICAQSSAPVSADTHSRMLQTLGRPACLLTNIFADGAQQIYDQCKSMKIPVLGCCLGPYDLRPLNLKHATACDYIWSA